MNEVQNIIDYKEVVKLEKEKDLLNQLVGELKAGKQALSQKLDEKSKDDKVIIKEKSINENPFRPSARFSTLMQPYTYTYKNLDNVVEDIRKHESERLKLDNVNLEVELDDTKLELVREKQALKLEKETVKDQVTEAKDKLKVLHSKSVEQFDKQIEILEKDCDKLQEELVKVKKNKTDEQTEKNRKQEIVDLKIRIEELETEIEDLSSINIFKRAWRKFTNYQVIKDANIEKLEKEDRVKEISREYPSQSGNFWNLTPFHWNW